jgi:hypothetical protein
MAYTSSAPISREMLFANSAAVSKSSVDKPSFFGRVFAAMMVARTRQAEREIARYLNGTGGKFTDEAEREIERRFLSNQTHW